MVQDVEAVRVSIMRRIHPAPLMNAFRTCSTSHTLSPNAHPSIQITNRIKILSQSILYYLVSPC